MTTYRRPFLKWAGGKYRILDHILKRLPKGRRLIEPFLGSGAVFLNTDYQRYLLGESNEDLVRLYQYLQKDGKRFIQYCKRYFNEGNNDPQAYYDFRDTFNSTHNTRMKAALFLYLNRHGYNGLCRYNKSGGYNVPFGRYVKPYFPLNEMHHFHEQAHQAKFLCGDFIQTMTQAKTGDIVYCDPPYAAWSSTANFTQYGAQGFHDDRQLELAECAKALAARGVVVIVSNHATKAIEKAYRGAKLHRFDVQRYISRMASRRDKVKELVAVFYPR